MLEYNWELLRPWWLLLVPVGGFLIYRLRRRASGSSAWSGVIQADLLSHLIKSDTKNTRSYTAWLLIIVWSMVVLGLAGPSIKARSAEHFVTIQGRVIVLDMSLSMNTADVKPSRLERARFKIRDILAIPGDMQYGLIVAGGDAFVVSPVTSDRKTLVNLLPALSTNIMPVQGNRIDQGIKLAVDLLQGAGISNGEIVLITDGANGDVDEQIDTLLENNIRLLVLAVGTKEGAPIKSEDGGFLKGLSGNIIISGVDSSTLEALAQRTNGRFSNHTADGSDLQRLQFEKTTLDIAASRKQGGIVQRTDLGFWLLLPGLLVLLIGFRRGYSFLLLPILMPFSEETVAFGWSDLWQRPDQQAAIAFGAGDYPKALESGSETWRGASLYRSKDYQGAIESWLNHEDSSSSYNLGNAFARDGKLQEAIEAYDRIKEEDKEYEDAQFNKQLVEALLEQQQQQQQNQSSDDQQPEDQDQQDSAENDQSKDSDASKESNQEGKKGDSKESQSEQQTDSKNDQDDSTDEDEASQESSNSVDQQPAEEQESPQSSTEEADMTREQKEQHEALQQWLRQIPDDPQGLLRRKFLYQYQQRQKSE